jgi:hypothetical protein
LAALDLEIYPTELRIEIMIEIKVKLRPFTVPNYAIAYMPPKLRQDGFVEPPKYHISELSDETLNKLCDQFRDDVFALARKKIIKCEKLTD